MSIKQLPYQRVWGVYINHSWSSIFPFSESIEKIRSKKYEQLKMLDLDYYKHTNLRLEQELAQITLHMTQRFFYSHRLGVQDWMKTDVHIFSIMRWHEKEIKTTKLIQIYSFLRHFFKLYIIIILKRKQMNKQALTLKRKISKIQHLQWIKSVFHYQKSLYNLSSLTESEKFHYSPADHVELTLMQDDACVCKPELFRSQEQPQSLRTPPPAEWKALKQKSFCFQTKNIFTNVYLPERHYRFKPLVNWINLQRSFLQISFRCCFFK